jgi:branched-chain amino acid transport system substrate-binding protein
MFRISSTNRIDAETAVTECWDEIGFNNWAYFPVNNDWGRSVPATFEGVVESLGGSNVMSEPLEQGSTNFLPQLTKLRNSDADTVAATIDVESLSILAKQAYEAGMTSNYRWVATSGNSVEEFRDLLADTPEALENWYFIAYYSPELEGEDQAFNDTFHETFSAAHPEIPISNPAAQGYQAVYIIAQAIERAGVYDGEAIRDALRETDFQGLTGHLTFDENGQAVPAVHFQQFVDGEPVVVECTP